MHVLFKHLFPIWVPQLGTRDTKSQYWPKTETGLKTLAMLDTDDTDDNQK